MLESNRRGSKWKLVLEQTEIESTHDVLAPTPLRSCAKCNCGAPPCQRNKHCLSEDADYAELDSGLKRQEGYRCMDVAGPQEGGPSQSSVEYIELGGNLGRPPRLLPKSVEATMIPPAPVDQLVDEFDTVYCTAAARRGAAESEGFQKKRSHSIQKEVGDPAAKGTLW
ncbi:hypothetical protein Tco_0572954 [Tanacetum coccineum]